MLEEFNSIDKLAETDLSRPKEGREREKERRGEGKRGRIASAQKAQL